jgi:hypothetical protein
MPEDAKKYVEATRKTYIISRSENIQSSKSNEQERHIFKPPEQKEHKNNFFSFSSEKKFLPPPLEPV